MGHARSNLTLLGLVVLSVHGYSRPEPNSFLDAPAPTHAALMRQVRTDPDVHDRYRRHFAMTTPELLRLFAELRLTRLSRDQRFAVYAVPDSGVLRSTNRLLKRGTLVWVDRRGQPVLMEVCGNPLTRGPGRPDSPNRVEAKLPEVGLEDLKPMFAGPVVQDDPSLQIVLYAEPRAPDLTAFVPTGTVTAESIEVPCEPTLTTITPPAAASPEPLIASGAVLPPLLGLLAGPAAVVARANLLGGLDPSEPPRTPATWEGPIEVVPEPGSLLALGLGMTVILVWRRARAK